MSEEERSGLIESATRAFALDGYEAASLNQIMHDAGMSKGAFYYYFTDKEDLYAMVVERLFEKLIGARGSPVFAPTNAAVFWVALEKYCECMAWFTARHLDEMRVLRGFQLTLRALRKPGLQKVRDTTRAHFVAIVDTALALGCARTDVPREVLVELLEAVDEVIDRYVFASITDVPTRRELARASRLGFDAMRRVLKPAPKKRLSAKKK